MVPDTLPLALPVPCGYNLMSGVLSFTLLLDEIGSSLFLSLSPDMRNNDHGPTNSLSNGKQ